MNNDFWLIVILPLVFAFALVGICVADSNKDEILASGKLIKCWSVGSHRNRVNYYLIQVGDKQELYKQYFINLHKIK